MKSFSKRLCSMLVVFLLFLAPLKFALAELSVPGAQFPTEGTALPNAGGTGTGGTGPYEGGNGTGGTGPYEGGNGTGETGGGLNGSGIVLPTGTGLSDKSILEIITFVLEWLLSIFLIIAVISFIITGIQFLMAMGGSYSDSYRNAKENFRLSILAVVVVGSSLIILKTIDYLLKAGGGGGSTPTTMV